MVRTVGVEEELLLVDASTAEPRAVAGAVLAGRTGTSLDAELQEQQMETNTLPCSSLGELRENLRLLRRQAALGAEPQGATVAALATFPLPVSPKLTQKDRYLRMAREFGSTVREQLTCGCHVHVRIGSDEEGVAVIDRIRRWLAPLLALSSNSPLWQGRDSGYASYRSQVWGRWPSAGPTDLFGSAAAYHRVVSQMLSTGTLLDKGMVYFDARLSHHCPTVEVRVGDVCSDVEDAVLLAALVRALVETSAREWRAGVPPHPVGTPLLRLAGWRAGRSGLEGVLLDPDVYRPRTAPAVLESLVEHVTPALEEAGDLGTVREGVARLLANGTGARWQRALYERTGRAADVVLEAVERTRA